MADTSSTVHRNHYRWIIFSIIFTIYFLVYFHRVSTSVIVADLLEAFETNAAALGFMSSMYFYLYAFEQPLVGYLADRLGPRRVIGYWSLIAATGCLIFGLAPTIHWATIGRGLIGIGVGGVYVPALKTMAVWFHKKEFTAMVGMLMAVGNLGAVIATTPLAWAADALGWRATFYLIGGVTVILSIISLLVIKDRPTQVTPPKPVEKERSQSSSDIRKVLTSGYFWISAVLFFGTYGTFVTIQGLWATPYLMVVLDIDRILASKLNMLIPVGVIIGAPLIGWLCEHRWIDKRHTLTILLSIYMLTWIGFIFFPHPLGMLGLAALQLIMGLVTGGFLSVLWGLVRDYASPKIMGMVSGLLNPAPIVGVAVFQGVTGAILNQTGKVSDLYALEGFQAAFGVCLAASAICLGLSFFIPKTPVS